MHLSDVAEYASVADTAVHFATGELARDAGIRQLFCVGELSRQTAEGFGKGARWFASLDELQDALLDELTAGRNVLIKGSRFMGLDRLVRQIENVNAANAANAANGAGG